MIVVDTNIAIAYLASESKVIRVTENALEHGEQLSLPTIVVAEILAYPELDAGTVAKTKTWLAALSVLPLDLGTAELSAEIRRETRLKLIDCIVAASALMAGAPLATRDKEFKKVKGLKILNW